MNSEIGKIKPKYFFFFFCYFVVLELGNTKLSNFMTSQMINSSFRRVEETILKGFFPHSLKENSIAEIQNPSDKQNTQAHLIALISDLVIGYLVSCHVAGRIH